MLSGSRLALEVPRGFRLGRAVCSYGYFLLAPNHWDPKAKAFETVLRVGGEGRVGVRVTEAGSGRGLLIRCGERLNRDHQGEVKGQVGRMLRVDEDLRDWWRLNPEAKKRGFGRLFRSATMWEDLVKTVTGCNTTWTSTIRMNKLLVEHVGKGGFPTAGEVARFGAKRLKEVCKVGYRAERIEGLARGVLAGEIDAGWYESDERTEEEVLAELRKLHGIGPYAAANMAQLLGHYDTLAIDTETYRHFCLTQGVERPKNPKLLEPMIEAYYEPMRPYRFLAYWFELWRDYERRVGPAEGWDRERDGGSFTASLLS
ncbi:hypothetical protein [Mucisphaera sp.]|uniref:hypothetical protein n=1 Tax=Mucisphaera sp. TaxID=2913024 RepID=UPI003D0D0DB9